MTRADKIRELCQEHHMSVTKLELALGFSNGSLTKNNGERTKYDRLVMVADYFSVPVEDLLYPNQQKYYTSEETSDIAQQIFDNKELRLLFDAAKDADSEDLKTVHQMLLALKNKGRREYDQ